ncbi:MAG: YbaN family protein [Rikenellaceae bacterium]
MKRLGILIGIISLALGTLGIVVPLLPTTPFLLLSAALFMRCSPKLHTWLMTNPLLGEYIRNYNENRSMPLRAKLTSISLVWISIGYCTLYVAKGIILAQIALVALASAITWHILSLGTTPRKR